MSGFTRSVDNKLYTRRALAEARTAYVKYCVIGASPNADGTVGITVTVNEAFREDSRQIVLEFWNFFLDSACKHRFDSA